jgi:hypothetical protein
MLFVSQLVQRWIVCDLDTAETVRVTIIIITPDPRMPKKSRHMKHVCVIGTHLIFERRHDGTFGGKKVSADCVRGFGLIDVKRL